MENISEANSGVLKSKKNQIYNNIYFDCDLSDIEITSEGILETSNSGIMRIDSIYKSQDSFVQKISFSNNFIDAIFNSQIDENGEYEPHLIFEAFYKKDSVLAIEALNDLFISYIDKPIFVNGIINTLLLMDKSACMSYSRTMLTAAFLYNHSYTKNSETYELIMECIDKWQDSSFLSLLKNVEFKSSHLNIFKDSLIDELSE